MKDDEGATKKYSNMVSFDTWSLRALVTISLPQTPQLQVHMSLMSSE